VLYEAEKKIVTKRTLRRRIAVAFRKGRKRFLKPQAHMRVKPLFSSSLAFIWQHPFIFVPFTFYIYTCSPTVGHFDPAVYADRSKQLSMSVSVIYHNLTTLLGHLVTYLPFGELAYRLNLMTAVIGAITISVFYALLHYVLKSRLTATMGGHLP